MSFLGRKLALRNLFFIARQILNMGKYLGLPLIHCCITKHTYVAVVDKVQNRLAGWKSRVLILAGKFTLIQAVTSTIPT